MEGKEKEFKGLAGWARSRDKKTGGSPYPTTKQRKEKKELKTSVRKALFKKRSQSSSGSLDEFLSYVKAIGNTSSNKYSSPNNKYNVIGFDHDDVSDDFIIKTGWSLSIDDDDAVDQDDSNINENDNSIDDNGSNSILDALPTSSDQSLAAIRAVIEAGKEEESIKNLESVINKKEREIEDVCSWRYEEFAESVEELLMVKSDILGLKDRIISFNNDLQTTGGELLNSLRLLRDLLKERDQLKISREALRDCLDIVQLVSVVHSHLRDSNFLIAQKVLQQLEREIPSVRKYSFVRDHLEPTFPLLKEKMLEGVTESCKNWFLQIRECSNEIGKFAMRQERALLDIESELSKGRTPSIRDIQLSEQSVFHNSHYQLSFQPLYSALQVHKGFGKLIQFKQYYSENRHKQALLTLKINSDESWGKTYNTYFRVIAGFFIVEHKVFTTTEHLTSNSSKERLWDMAIAKMKAVLEEQTSFTRDSITLRGMKVSLYAFSRTLQVYGFHTTPLDFLFGKLKEAFTTVTIASRLDAYKQIVAILGSHKPLEVTSLPSFQSLLVPNGLVPPSLKSPSFPLQFHFSLCVPCYGNHVRDLIKELREFSRHLPGVDSFIRLGMERLFNALNNHFIASIKASKSRERLVQGWIDLAQLDTMSSEWDHISTLREDRKGLASTGSSSFFSEGFGREKKQIETLLTDGIKHDIGTHLDEAKLHWMPSSSTNKPREYVSALATFLESLFPLLEALPVGMRKELRLLSFQSMADGLMNMLLGAQHFNVSAIKSLDRDIEALEFLALKNDVSGVFDEWQQLISLLLSDKIEGYLDMEVRGLKYPCLGNPMKILSILECFSRGSKFKFKRHSKMEKQLETVVAHLRDVVKGME